MQRGSRHVVVPEKETDTDEDFFAMTSQGASLPPMASHDSSLGFQETDIFDDDLFNEDLFTPSMASPEHEARDPQSSGPGLPFGEGIQFVHSCLSNDLQN